ncbi:alpha/beta fold hydrolase [Tumidithrix elongata RA019]|uniref:Alpha/beta fold hydrolase n=1 Tax=Tumidithrix elongata BACA0141 TaxID=2716417 RepID=A0AAW9PUD5_9CYAN|nr:alpha/beta fold hydrolase [Tumidithrix elongata RA019]
MTTFHTISIDGLDIFYREAGSRNNPTILLLHGSPTSSHMFRNLMPALADCFHLVAPDYPGFGYSSMPSVDEFDYTFDRLAEVMADFIAAIGLKRYSLYLMDYGGTKHCFPNCLVQCQLAAIGTDIDKPPNPDSWAFGYTQQ